MKAVAPSVGVLSRLSPPSLRSLGGRDVDSAAHAVRALEEDWQRGGVPSLERHWFDQGSDESLSVLAALVKADLRCRYARGDRPAVADYLDRFPGLRDVHDRVVSLVYEEYCLREEQGEAIDPEQFCERYDPWRDSLASQLRYHRLLSQVVAAPATQPRFPEPGDEFQEFRLRAVLGRGGVARVYLAQDTRLGDREVALKISPDRGKEPEIQARLNHPHIVEVHSVTPPEPGTGLRGLCMRYRAGLSLDEVIRWVDPSSHPRRARALWDALAPKSRADWEKGPTSPGWVGFPAHGRYADGVAWVVLTVARALEHAHARGVLHRDVKPANVLLTFDGGPQLLDFNLAHEPHNAERAEAALRGGTLPYMAPEQLEAFLNPSQWATVGETADLYAVGLLLTELLTGDRPEAPDPALPLPRAISDMLDRRASARRSLREQNPTVPHALCAIAEKCLAFDPADRYSSASELADDLDRYLARRPLAHAPNTSKAELARNWTTRNRVGLGLGLAAALLLTARVLTLEGRDDAPRYAAWGGEYLDKNEIGKARDNYERALTLNPSLAAPYEGLGLIAARNRQYDLSRQYYDGAIRNTEHSGSLKDEVKRAAMARLYARRAQSLRRLGNDQQSDLTPEGFRAAEPYYTAAAADIAQARQYFKDADYVVRMMIELNSAWVEIGLGDVASKFDRYEESVAHFRRAQAQIQKALEYGPRGADEKELIGLADGVELRLRTDEPLLSRLRQERGNPAESAGSETAAGAAPATAAD